MTLIGRRRLGSARGRVRPAGRGRRARRAAAQPASGGAGRAEGRGQTATALRLATTVVRLDDPAQRAIAEADPGRLATGPHPVLLDEWQRLPASWDVVRRAVDAGASPGQYLLTGSASPAAPPTHSGAGRIVSVRMRPLSLAERGVGVPPVSLLALLSGRRPQLSGATDVTLEQYTHEIARSGFPGLRHLEGRRCARSSTATCAGSSTPTSTTWGNASGTRRPCGAGWRPTRPSPRPRRRTRRSATRRRPGTARSQRRPRRSATATSSSGCGSSSRFPRGCRLATRSPSWPRRPSTTSPIPARGPARGR